jgi:hypothetical protein
MATFDTQITANNRQQPPIFSCSNGSIIPAAPGGRHDRAPGIANDPDAERISSMVRSAMTRLPKQPEVQSGCLAPVASRSGELRPSGRDVRRHLRIDAARPETHIR